MKIENYQLADIIFPYLHISIFPSPSGEEFKLLESLQGYFFVYKSYIFSTPLLRLLPSGGEDGRGLLINMQPIPLIHLNSHDTLLSYSFT